MCYYTSEGCISGSWRKMVLKKFLMLSFLGVCGMTVVCGMVCQNIEESAAKSEIRHKQKGTGETSEARRYINKRIKGYLLTESNPNFEVVRSLGKNRYQLISRIDIDSSNLFAGIYGTKIYFNAIAKHPNRQGGWELEHLRIQDEVLIENSVIIIGGK